MFPQVGSEVMVSCEPAPARVVSVGPRYVQLEWPWREVDNSSFFQWDGTFALPYGESQSEWVPYVTEPAVSELAVGDVCTVSIPRTRLHVAHYEKYEPARNLGWSPAPTAGIYVVPEERMDQEEGGCMLYLGGADPILVEPLSE
ncbi:hypothetical protein OKJ48_38470 [Streptomyces kunmingensis]|uniref:Uncharacterized protein n=1 Tax=Streptomyces kunmingensis TaxID=68225 RepID=A0ABU6CMZ7_9ACTN|nr:hypothetical protein [Streptomyces kunmingensis]MEB3966067.1 hypothetical protein [Streptomyces kunmingensis]